MAGLRRRDAQALERLYTEYGGLIAHWAQAAGAEREDVVQDVLFKVWRAGHRLTPDTRLPGLLKTITQNTVRNRFRTQSRKPTVPAGLEPSGDATSDPIPDATDRIVLRQALESLAPRERRCLELLYVSDLPLAEVARQIGASTEATKSLAARARRRIRADLEKEPAAKPGQPTGVRLAQVARSTATKIAAALAAVLTAGALTSAAAKPASSPEEQVAAPPVRTQVVAPIGVALPPSDLTPIAHRMDPAPGGPSPEATGAHAEAAPEAETRPPDPVEPDPEPSGDPRVNVRSKDGCPEGESDTTEGEGTDEGNGPHGWLGPLTGSPQIPPRGEGDSTESSDSPSCPR